MRRCCLDFDDGGAGGGGATAGRPRQRPGSADRREVLLFEGLEDTGDGIELGLGWCGVGDAFGQCTLGELEGGVNGRTGSAESSSSVSVPMPRTAPDATTVPGASPMVTMVKWALLAGCAVAFPARPSRTTPVTVAAASPMLSARFALVRMPFLASLLLGGLAIAAQGRGSAIVPF